MKSRRKKLVGYTYIHVYKIYLATNSSHHISSQMKEKPPPEINARTISKSNYTKR